MDKMNIIKGSQDERIMGDITAALSSSPRVPTTCVRVFVHDGYVRLQGTVDSLDEKQAAEEAASQVNGVRGVENDITVSADREVSDLELTRLVNDKLVQAGLAGVGAKVESGNAFLMGVIPNVAVKRQASELAGAVSGVRDVISELEIAAGEPVDDITLADDVAETLSDDPSLNTIYLEVRAEDGNVVLMGEVDNDKLLQRATAIAESVPGVKHVENLMAIRA